MKLIILRYHSQNYPKMVVGSLQVRLADAKGLRNTDHLDKSDPYAVFEYGGQKRRTSVPNGRGRVPKRDEKLTFEAEFPGSGHDCHKLTLRIMDKDHFSSEDFVGEAEVNCAECM